MKLIDLFEGISSILYHSTGIWKLIDILNENRFLLTPTLGTSSDEQLNQKKQYFFSTTRSKVGQYHYPVSEYEQGRTIIVLDGDKLMNAGFSGSPVDYWGNQYKDEMEDRIISNKSEITDALKYIKEIHILLNTNNDDDRTKSMVKLLRKVMIICKTSSIPIFVYNDTSSFNLLNKKNSNKGLNLNSTHEDSDYFYRRRSNWFAPYIQLLMIDEYNRLDKDAKRLLDRWYNKRDTISQLKATIHNDRTGDGRSNLVKFIGYMREKDLSSVEDYYSYIERKWGSVSPTS